MMLSKVIIGSSNMFNDYSMLKIIMKLFDTSNMGQKVDILRCKIIEKLDAFMVNDRLI